MTLRTFVVVAIQLVVVAVAGVYGVARFFTSVPGSPYDGPPPALDAFEVALRDRLKRHVEMLAAGERNLANPDALDAAAQYIEATLASYHFRTVPRVYTVGGRQVRNIEVVIEPNRDPATAETIVVGAHYDSAIGTPGANDNASGVAVLLEIMYQIGRPDQMRHRIRFVFFVNQEAPYGATDDMGSRRYVRDLAARGDRVTAMYSLESVGYFSTERNSQRYPGLLKLLLPDRGNFVAFVGSLGSRELLNETVRAFREYPRIPSVGISVPAFLRGMNWSDHRSFGRQGLPAILITGMAPYRDPNYSKPSDTPDKLDYLRMTHLVRAMEGTIREMIR